MSGVSDVPATQVRHSRDSARVYEEGMLCVQDGNYAAALELLSTANEDAVFGSAYALGLMAQQGYGCLKNENAAYAYFVQSSRRGHSVAGYEVAMMLHGLSWRDTTHAEDVRAFCLFRAAARGTEQCRPVLHAHHMLGECYLQGRGVAQDNSKALQKFTQHRELCFAHTDSVQDALLLCPRSSLYLGLMYLNGMGVRSSCATAQLYFQDANQGGVSRKIVRSLNAPISLP